MRIDGWAVFNRRRLPRQQYPAYCRDRAIDFHPAKINTGWNPGSKEVHSVPLNRTAASAGSILCQFLDYSSIEDSRPLIVFRGV
jgi:hypothetical protein